MPPTRISDGVLSPTVTKMPAAGTPCTATSVPIGKRARLSSICGALGPITRPTGPRSPASESSCGENNLGPGSRHGLIRSRAGRVGSGARAPRSRSWPGASSTSRSTTSRRGPPARQTAPSQCVPGGSLGVVNAYPSAASSGRWNPSIAQDPEPGTTSAGTTKRPRMQQSAADSSSGGTAMRSVRSRRVASCTSGRGSGASLRAAASSASGASSGAGNSRAIAAAAAASITNRIDVRTDTPVA